MYDFGNFCNVDAIYLVQLGNNTFPPSKQCEYRRRENETSEDLDCHKLVPTYFSYIWPKLELYHKKRMKMSSKLKKYWNGFKKYSKYSKYKMH